MSKFIELNTNYEYKPDGFIPGKMLLRRDEILYVQKTYDNKKGCHQAWVYIKRPSEDGDPEFFPVKETYEQIKKMLRR